MTRIQFAQRFCCLVSCSLVAEVLTLAGSEALRVWNVVQESRVVRQPGVPLSDHKGDHYRRPAGRQQLHQHAAHGRLDHGAGHGVGPATMAPRARSSLEAWTVTRFLAGSLDGATPDVRSLDSVASAGVREPVTSPSPIASAPSVVAAARASLWSIPISQVDVGVDQPWRPGQVP